MCKSLAAKTEKECCSTNSISLPLVYLNHGKNHPHAVATARKPGTTGAVVQRSEFAATSTAYFNTEQAWSEFSFGLVAQGFLNSASVGFRPVYGVPLPLRDRPKKLGDNVVQLEEWRRSFDITQSVLVEWSLVDIGADAGALRQCLDRGFIGQYKLPSCIPEQRHLLQSMAGGPPVWSAGIDLDENGKRVVTAMDQAGVTLATDDPEQTAQFLNRLAVPGLGDTPAPVPQSAPMPAPAPAPSAPVGATPAPIIRQEDVPAIVQAVTAEVNRRLSEGQAPAPDTVEIVADVATTAVQSAADYAAGVIPD